MNLIALLSMGVFSAFGGLLLYTGRARRIGNDPHCRKCNYLLHGLSSERCPECGSALSPAAIVYGEPHRRWRSFLAGCLILLMCAALLLTGATSGLQNVDWYQYKPAYFVLKDLNSSLPADQQKAWTELMHRDRTSSLSPKTRDKMALFALTRQANAAQPYNSLDFDTINYFGARCLAKDLPADQITRFFDQSTRMKLSVRPKVVKDDRVPFVAAHDGLGPATNNFWTKLVITSVIIDGKDQRTGGGSCAYGGSGAGSFGSDINCPTPGKHQISVTMHVESFIGLMGSISSSTLEYQSDQTMTANFEVLPLKPPNFIHAIFDPKLTAAMNAALKPGDFNYSAANHSLNGEIYFKNPPISAAYEVVARFGGKDHSLGEVTCL
jgi:hypothetical protein